MTHRWLLILLVWVGLCAGCGSDGSGDDSNDTDSEISTDDTDSDSDTDTVSPGPYQVQINGVDVPVARTDNFAVPVNYVHVSYAGQPMNVVVTADAVIAGYTLSPARLMLGDAAAGNELSFTMTEPTYVVLEIPGNERLFVLVDPPEVNAPAMGAANVVNVANIAGIDNTGETDVTALLQGAIDAASGAAQNIVYVPAGTYATKALNLKSDMTLYLAAGAVLKNVVTAGDLLSHPSGYVQIEGCSRGFITMNGVTNAHLAGRGTIDANGAVLQASDKKMFAVKIENSDSCTVDGIVSQDSAFWNTMIFRSTDIALTNYKVINNRLNGEYNETDGVDFNNCTDSLLRNAFLYTGDDCMAVKSDDIPDDEDYAATIDPAEGEYMAVDNILHEQVVCYSGSSACKVGTKTFGPTMSNIVYRDIDVVTTDRALVIDAVDTTEVVGTVFENIRIDNVTGRIVDFNMDPESIYWRTTVGICTVTDTAVTNVSSAVSKECRIGGNIHNWNENDEYYGNEYFINGVAFTNFSVAGNVITALDDADASFNVNEYVTDVTFAP
ncbi:MAG: hypothetical protein JXX29_05530 [Deltaproteobacteria bacterium]|nr:hypothetical protein [Deltaproteobacteria bacterium]MBN2671110.1 hypothetical protein [Deltaproteobacteria bacterium]